MTATVDLRVISMLVLRQTTTLGDCYNVSRTQRKQNRAQYGSLTYPELYH